MSEGDWMADANERCQGRTGARDQIELYQWAQRQTGANPEAVDAGEKDGGDDAQRG